MGRESNRYGIYTYNLDNNFGNRITLPHPNDAKHKHTKISIAGWQAGKQTRPSTRVRAWDDGGMSAAVYHPH